ncbi:MULTISPECIES: XVIPCD domain-containing protein [Xanthomonas]|uniref:XVIPCD domain-containing protein n=1 Tax=Xanthomonas TaxID=338 RepID=UPI000E1E45BA|nr:MULTISPECIES: XVIPCD domain-containing protein [Xanthomonas]
MVDPRVEQLLNEVEKQSGLPPSAARDFREAVETSPYLASAMAQAIESGSLRHLSVSTRPNEGGHYDASTGTVNVSADVFQRTKQSDRVDLLAGVLGHETGHALMAKSAEHSRYKLAYGIDQALKEGAQYGEPVVDVTPIAKEYLASARRDEGLAELMSMNSVASRVATTTGEVNQKVLLRRLDPTTACVTNDQLEPGVRLDKHGLQLTQGRIASPAVEAVAECHFDKGGSTLGHKGTSAYQAYYTAYAIGAGADIWKDRANVTAQPMPKLGYNLQELGVSAQQAEDAGIDLGGVGKTFGFADTSRGQVRPVEVRQLGAGNSNRPELMSYNEVQPQRILADNPTHPDHSTYQQIHSWVRGTGNWNDEESRNVSAALYKQQVDDPLIKRVDGVTGGLGKDGAHNVFAVYAPHGMEVAPMFHTHVDGRQAAQEPAQQNLQQAETIKQDQVRQQALEQTQQQSAQQEQGQRMTMGGP